MGIFKLNKLYYLLWVLNTLPPLPLPQLRPLQPILKVPSWDLTLKAQNPSPVCHSSQLVPTLSYSNALPQMFGKNARTRKINTVSPSSNVSSLDPSGLTLVLVSTLDPTIPPMLSPHFSIKLSKTITVTVRLTSIFPPWMLTSLTAHHSQRMRTR